MDIESKKWRIKATGLGSCTLQNKQTSETKFIPNADVPSATYLAMIHEDQFDSEMETLFNSH